MSDAFKAAAIQMSASPDKAANLKKADTLVREAVLDGAVLVALPELFNCLASHRIIVEQAEPVPGPTSTAMCALARECGITLLAGSIAEQCEGDRAFNTSLLIGPDGSILANYRKIHLFDVELEGSPPIAESRWFVRGEDLCVTETPLGRLGQSICYDLRFPELFRGLADRGADIIFVPAAFTAKTGRAHWEVLLRARAIENQAFVIAPNQFGEQIEGVPLYGHSAIIDPWGTIIFQKSNQTCIYTADLSYDVLKTSRKDFPVWMDADNDIIRSP